MVDGHLQKSELTEEFHSRLSTQALCPHVGHLLIGVCSPVCLGHLSKARKWKSPMHPFHPQQAEPGLCSHMVLITPREHQKQLFSPKKTFWGNCWTGGGETRAVRQGRGEAAASPHGACCCRTSRSDPGGCARTGGAVPRWGCGQSNAPGTGLGAEQPRSNSAAAWPGPSPACGGTLQQPHRRPQGCATR